MKFTVEITLENVAGPEQEADWVIDAFCGSIGAQNGAKPPLHITVGRYISDELVESVYEVVYAETPF